MAVQGFAQMMVMLEGGLQALLQNHPMLITADHIVHLLLQLCCAAATAPALAAVYGWLAPAALGQTSSCATWQPAAHFRRAAAASLGRG